MTQNILAQKGAVMAVVIALAAPPAAQAADRRADELQAVVNCRTVSDSAQRLACYDAAAARLDEAEAKGEVVVLDREQRRQARREAFGFTLPSIDLFTRDDSEKMDRQAFKVVRAWENNAGQWSMELDSGAVWRQTDQERLSHGPKAGSSVEIRSAAMGSFLMNVDGQRAIRVKRDK